MSSRPLTATYRPQTFAQVVGQDQIKKILSRSAAEEKIAPAYLFSGTRGVGKTTLARILAKALNCVHYPAQEPCNQCEYCRQITRGASVDVAEIDGASHTGVDHIRKLNEEIGYAPLECRYKMIIIDEAHMLSKNAFNALLKTLEEPPRHAVFILATTEPHKFPQTIISRCQHFTFKRVRHKEMETFLEGILEREGIGFDPQALKIIIRKGGGSVRDCLSALSQILALGQERLELQEVKDILGLAGQEILHALIQACTGQDCLKIMDITQNLLDTGLDLGFFLQDMSTLWRNLFLLKQTGEQAFDFLELPLEECSELKAMADSISLSRIHASWQLTLEGQRRVMTSTDPGLALELLLLNLAYLPDLLPLKQLQTETSRPPESKEPASKQSRPDPDKGRTPQGGQEKANPAPNTPPQPPQSPAEPAPRAPADASLDWKGFLDYFNAKSNGTALPNLNQCTGHIRDNVLEIDCTPFLAGLLKSGKKMQVLKSMASEYFQRDMQVRLQSEPDKAPQKPADLKQSIRKNPRVQTMLRDFQARIIDVGTNQKE
ncbi:MAG: DNA polymerase III subunit gamma/tau [Desulfohalobiaceae bacterium]|nr:DNA polymerase III subunit gamma/tau [Desulfohalobiaceae bacterium]